MIEKTMQNINKISCTHVEKIKENQYRISFTGGLFAALDKQANIETMIKQKCGSEFDIKIEYGDGLDSIITFNKK